MVPGWQFHSRDGFRWSASPSLAPYGAVTEWQIMIDGVDLPEGLAGHQGYQYLPIDIGRITRISCSWGPVHCRGICAGDGVIHIETDQSVRAPLISASLSTGNESGDPGPYIFTPKATKNVDRLGQNISFSIRRKLDSIHYGLTLNQIQYPDSDSLLLTQLESTDWGHIQVKTLGVGSFLILNTNKHQFKYHGHYYAAGNLPDDELLYADLVFIPERGAEIPVTRRYGHSQFSWESICRNGSETELTYSDFREIIRTSDSISVKTRRLETGRHSLFFELRGTVSGKVCSAGLRFDRHVESLDPGNNHDMTGAACFLDVEFPERKSAVLRIQHSIRFQNNTVYPAVHIPLRFKLKNGIGLLAYFSASVFPGLMPLNVMNPVSWPDGDPYLYRVSESPATARLETGIRFLMNIHPGLDQFLGLQVRHSGNQVVFHENSVEQVPEMFDGPDWYTADGYSASLLSVTRFRWYGTEHELTASLKGGFGGFGNWEKYWSNRLNFSAGYRLIFQPNDAFQLITEIYYDPENTWHEYWNNAAELDKLPEQTRLRVHFWKSLANGRLQINLRYDHFSKKAVLYHPTGASLDPSLFLIINILL